MILVRKVTVRINGVDTVAPCEVWLNNYEELLDHRMKVYKPVSAENNLPFSPIAAHEHIFFEIVEDQFRWAKKDFISIEEETE